MASKFWNLTILSAAGGSLLGLAAAHIQRTGAVMAFVYIGALFVGYAFWGVMAGISHKRRMDSIDPQKQI